MNIRKISDAYPLMVKRIINNSLLSLLVVLLVIFARVFLLSSNSLILTLITSIIFLTTSLLRKSNLSLHQVLIMILLIVILPQTIIAALEIPISTFACSSLGRTPIKNLSHVSLGKQVKACGKILRCDRIELKYTENIWEVCLLYDSSNPKNKAVLYNFDITSTKTLKGDFSNLADSDDPLLGLQLDQYINKGPVALDVFMLNNDHCDFSKLCDEIDDVTVELYRFYSPK